ncbi:hypothetical protein, partial [Mucilaginibacter antarcticus]
ENVFTALAAIVRQLIAWSLCHGIRWSTSPEYQTGTLYSFTSGYILKNRAIAKLSKMSFDCPLKLPGIVLSQVLADGSVRFVFVLC